MTRHGFTTGLKRDLTNTEASQELITHGSVMPTLRQHQGQTGMIDVALGEGLTAKDGCSDV